MGRGCDGVLEPAQPRGTPLRLSPKQRVLVGAITTVAFVGIGLSLWAEGRPLVGGVLTALGLYRFVAWVREVRAAYS